MRINCAHTHTHQRETGWIGQYHPACSHDRITPLSSCFHPAAICFPSRYPVLSLRCWVSEYRHPISLPIITQRPIRSRWEKSGAIVWVIRGERLDVGGDSEQHGKGGVSVWRTTLDCTLQSAAVFSAPLLSSYTPPDPTLHFTYRCSSLYDVPLAIFTMVW